MLSSRRVAQQSYKRRKLAARRERIRRESELRRRTWSKGTDSAKAVIRSYMDKRLKQILATDRPRLDKVLDVCHLATGEGMHEFLAAHKPKVSAEKMSDLQKEYQTYFNGILEDFGVNSPEELTDEQKDDFFTKVNDGWIEGEGEKKS